MAEPQVQCEIGLHVYGAWGEWYHPVGTESIYRDAACENCGGVLTDGRGIFDWREDDPEHDTVDPEHVRVIGGKLDDAYQSVANALRELEGVK